ncbi:MAG: hypothetical protein K2K70_13330 [Lachnospiraceae bacterium]|nr:hypothetical protein [Lachnospiraceae bacterium]
MEQKNKKVIGIVGILVATMLVIGIAGAANARKIANVVKEKTSSPEEYYRYVEGKNRDAALKEMDTSYTSYRDTVTKQESQQQKVTYQIELGDTLKALASGYGIESASIVTNAKSDGSVLANHSVLQINGKDAANINTYMDYAAKEGYIQIPELSSSYLSLSSTLQEADGVIPSSYLYMMDGDAAKYLPESKQLQTFVTTYSDIVMKNLDKVERSEETLTAGDVSAKYTKLVVSCDETGALKISKEVLEKLKDDQTVKEFIENIDQKAYTSFQEEITKGLKDLEKESAGDGKLEMIVYVDDDAKIVGRTVTVDSGDGESFGFKVLQPSKDGKTGYLLQFSADGMDYVTLTGNMEEKSGKLSGDFTLSMDESLNPGDGSILSMTDLVKISVSDLDKKALEKDGALKGSMELSSEQIAAVAGYKLRIDMDNTKDQINNKIAVLVGSDEFATIQITSEEGEDPGVTPPEDGAKVYDLSNEIELSTYTSEIDLISFMTDLKTNCGADFTSLLLGLML